MVFKLLYAVFKLKSNSSFRLNVLLVHFYETLQYRFEIIAAEHFQKCLGKLPKIYSVKCAGFEARRRYRIAKLIG
jgi:hypothetical protein